MSHSKSLWDVQVFTVFTILIAIISASYDEVVSDKEGQTLDEDDQGAIAFLLRTVLTLTGHYTKTEIEHEDRVRYKAEIQANLADRGLIRTSVNDAVDNVNQEEEEAADIAFDGTSDDANLQTVGDDEAAGTGAVSIELVPTALRKSDDGNEGEDPTGDI